jgi:dTDP-4-amino-4,6-dideoxygalactose transaminase
MVNMTSSAELQQAAGGTTAADRELFPFAAWPLFDSDEIAVAQRILSSGKVNYWTGEEGRLFEREYAEYTGCKHAVALANGTLALELALRVLGVGPGDEVVTSARTFIASASCAVAVGARPVVADVDPDSGNLTADSIRAVLTPRTRAIVAVHLGGWPCDMDPILELAKTHGLKVIEDCAQAHGARYRGAPVGSIGDIGAFSFCQDKIISTAGEGGMITLNSTEMWEQAWAYKDHGKSYDAVYRTAHQPGFRWLHESFGSNWRLTEIQSAIGRLQLAKLDRWVERRRQNAATLTACLVDVAALRIPVPAERVYHSYYKYYAFIRTELLRDGWNRDRVVDEVNARGVPCFTGSCSEIYLEKAFPEEWRPAERLLAARKLGETAIMLLVHPTLAVEQVECAAQTLREIMIEATAPSSAG